MSTPAAFVRIAAAERVAESLRHEGRHLAVGGLWGASAALLVAGLRGALSRPSLIVTADDGDTNSFADDLATFGVVDVHRLPSRELDADGKVEPLSESARTQALSGIAAHDASTSGPIVVVASLEALIQPAPDLRALGARGVTFRKGQRVDIDGLITNCLGAGLRRVPLVVAQGEVSRRGDVLDVFPIAASDAVRLEFFDDELESIRTFDPDSQRSLLVLDAVELRVGASGADAPGRQTNVLQYLVRKDLNVFWFEPLRIGERKQTLTTLGGTATRNAMIALQESLARLTWIELGSLPSRDVDFRILSAGGGAASGETDPLGRLRSIRGLDGGVVEIVCRTEAEERRLREVFAHRDIDLAAERVQLRVGVLSRGFRVADLRWTILSNVEFAGVPASARVRARPKLPTRAIQTFFELGPGDLVVHAVQGIALFEGIERIHRGDAEEDCLRLQFRDEVRLLVPVSKIHLVQKYVGAGGTAQVKLDKLGGKGFLRRKAEVQQSLYDLASELLEVEVERERLRRAPFPRDPLEDDFLDGFPFEDTPDQVQCWAETRAELESDRPMDRLLCGDVGFGKTEIAMRAAFKVAITGRQVTVLVPTTVLAEQHLRTFGARFAPHGLRVEAVSRFGSAKRKREILADCAVGRVDVLLGTHRLLGADVAFKDLGLVIVDEEQRFGVRQKEHMKRMRAGVDVLSLSATPIPRTLHASLLGIRRISTLSTPPPGRQDVATKVAWRDETIFRDAITHELARGGQVFVLHERIAGLQELAATVKRLAPTARVAIGHGQLGERELESTLRAFVRGDRDVLVCTSIIENGLDIPRANTILVDRAEMFGLAELHQLRGRVGRSDVRAECWLLMDPAHPPSDAARRRLQALADFSHLGAGFAIAMKDLEIRGSGNLLGPQQSGHIAAVGYEMYCQLLRSAVDQAREHGGATPIEIREVDVDLQVSAFVPEEFVGDAKARLELLREMDAAISPDEAVKVRADLIDRHGPLPRPLEILLRVFLLKHLLMDQDVIALQRTGPDRVVVRHAPGQPLGGAWLESFTDVRRVEPGKTHLVLPLRAGRRVADWTPEQMLQFLLECLCGDPGLPKIAECGRNRADGKRAASPSPSSSGSTSRRR